MTKKETILIGILGLLVVIVFSWLGFVVLNRLTKSQSSEVLTNPFLTNIVSTSVPTAQATATQVAVSTSTPLPIPTPMLPVVPFLPSSGANLNVYFRNILAATGRFTELSDKATQRIKDQQFDQLPPIIDEMQKARYSFWMVPAPLCAEEFRSAVERSMATSISGYMDFVDGKLIEGNQKLSQAESTMAWATDKTKNLALSCELAGYQGK